MSTSLLYQAFGIRGYRYVRSDYVEGAVLFTIEQERANLRCSACGSSRVTAHGGEPRLFRLVPIGLKPTRKIPVMNGSIPCKLLIFDMYSGSKRAERQVPEGSVT